MSKPMYLPIDYSNKTNKCKSDSEQNGDVGVEENKEDLQLCILESSNLDQDILDKLKGDAIGDTVFSERSVAKILLKLNTSEWNEEFETELETLWDMTLEKDVCIYLFEVNYPTIFVSVLLNYHHNKRLVEITLGILVNMLCADLKDKYALEEDELNYFINTLKYTNDDVGVQQQAYRFFRCLISKFKMNICIDQELFNSILFVLDNALNRELLCETLHLLSYYDKEDMCIKDKQIIKMLGLTISAFENLLPENQVDYEIYSNTTLQLVLHTIRVFGNFSKIFKNKKDYFERRLKNCLKRFQNLCREVIQQFKEDINWISDLELMEDIFIEMYRVSVSGMFSYEKNIFYNMLKTVERVQQLDTLESHWFLLYPTSGILASVVSGVTDRETLIRDLKDMENVNVSSCLRYLEENLEEQYTKDICTELIAELDKSQTDFGQSSS